MGDSAHTQSGKNPIHGLDEVIEIFRSERKALGVIATYAIGVGTLSLIVPITVQSLVNSVALGSVLQPIAVLTFFVFALLTLAGVMNVLQIWVIEFLQRRMFVRSSLGMADRLLRLEWSVQKREYLPETFNRFFDLFPAQKFIAQILLDGIALLLQTGIGLLLLAFYHPYLLAFDVLLVGAIFWIAWVLGRGALYSALKESSAKFRLGAWFQEFARNVYLFRTGRGGRFALRRTDQLVQSYLNARESHFRILMRQWVASMGLQVIVSTILLGLGGLLVIKNQLTLGQLVAAELIVSGIVGGISKLTKYLEIFYDLTAAMSKVEHVLTLETEREGGERVQIDTTPGLSIRIESEQSLELPAGTHHVISVASRVEADRWVELLAGVKAPESGHVYFNGAEVRDLNPVSLRSLLTVVRGGDTFPATIEENLKLEEVDLPRAVLWEALEAVDLRARVEEFELRLETELTSAGLPLTLGESIRLSVARVLLQPVRFVLLDRVLDDWSEAQVREYAKQFARMRSGVTLVVLTQSAALKGWIGSQPAARIVRAADGSTARSSP